MEHADAVTAASSRNSTLPQYIMYIYLTHDQISVYYTFKHLFLFIKTNEVIDNNGEVNDFSHWLPGWPRNQSNFDRITWLVMRDPNMTYHGMLNSHPMTVSYPLCQKSARHNGK